MYLDFRFGRHRRKCFIIFGVFLFIGSSIAACPFPSVPYAARYVNVTGGAGQSNWKIKYVCDSGYELFGDDVRECKNGEWRGDEDELPHCAVNVALNKPASSSSQVGGGAAQNAVDGKTGTVHEGNKCVETKSEKSPWWTVDLLEAYPVQHVRLTTRCCDDVPIKKAEIRVGNSTTPGNNQLCNWIPKALDEGVTETLDCFDDLVGRYVSIVMTGVETVLSVCEVEVFSSKEISLASCPTDVPPDELSVFQGSCYRFPDGEVSGFEAAEDKCAEGRGQHLMAELDDRENKFVTSRLENTLDDNIMAWVGARREDSRWQWVTGVEVEDKAIDWGRGQPNNYNQEQNCAVLDSELDWKWNDISCRISGVVVCRGPPSKCPSPPVGVGAYYTGSLEVDGAGITYHCPLGEMPIGDVNQTCDGETGSWSGEPISCKPVDCGQVPGLADGEVHVLDGRTTWGARVQYRCKDSYSLIDGDDTRTCEEKGWTGRTPRCAYTRCGEPSFVENADVKVTGDENYSLGTKISYTCHPGHKASGSLSRECKLGGKWTGSPPKCEFVDCGDPPRLQNGHFELLDARTSFGAEVEYACNSNYRLNTVTRTRKCEATGRWSRTLITCEEILCPTPKAPAGGRVSGYDRSIGSSIEFSCLTGHVLEGPEKLSCDSDGEWSGRSPICRFVDCGALPQVEDGTAHYVNGSTHLGSQARYTCGRSHTLDGQELRECLPSGRWSGSEPSCSEIRCSLPPRPNNTIISVSSTERLHGTSVIRNKLSMKAAYRVGSTLKYRCERGYILEKEDGSDARVMTRRCTRSGTWTGSVPHCKYVDCGPPEKPKNAEVTLPIANGTFYGAYAY